MWRLVVLTWGFGGLVGVGGGVYGDRCVWLGWWFGCRVSGLGGAVPEGSVPGWVSGWGGVPGYRWLWIMGVLGYPWGWVRGGCFGAVCARHACIKMRYPSTPLEIPPLPPGG